MRSLVRVRALALAFSPSLLLVLATLWGRSPRLYFEALAPDGSVAVAAALTLVVSALLALGNYRPAAARTRPVWFYPGVAALCGAGVLAILAGAQTLDPDPRYDAVYGMTHHHVQPLLGLVLAALALSAPASTRAARPRVPALPWSLVPGAAIGALAATDQPTGYETSIAYLMLAATLGLWMLLDLVEARSAVAATRGEDTVGDVAVPREIGRGLFLLGVVACCAVGVWLTWPAWRPGIITNMDAPRHLLRAKIMAEMFLPNGHVDGWSPYWYLGAQLFLFQSYGYFFLIGAVTDLLDGLVRLQGVFKFFYCLPIVLLPAAVAWLSRGLGTTRRAALLAAFASLTLSAAVGYGIRGVYGIGLLLQGVGVVLFALALPVVLDALDGKRRQSWAAALLLGVVLVTHFITAAYTMAASGLIALALAVSRREMAPLFRYGALAAAALLLSGHALFPSLELRELAGGAVGWGSGEDRLEHFFSGSSVGPPWLIWPGFVAALVAIVRGGSRLRLAALLMFATAILAASTPLWLEPRVVTKILGVLLRPRALPYACVLTAVFIGVAFDAVISRLASGREGAVLPWRSAAVAVAMVGFACVGFVELSSLRSMVSTEATLKRRNQESYMQLARWLKGNVRKPAVIEIARRSFESKATGARSVISILNLDTGLFTLSGDQAELTRAGARNRALRGGALGRHAERAVKILRLFGVSHVVATDAETRRQFDESPGYDLVYENDKAAVFAVQDSGSWLTGAGIAIKNFVYRPEHLRWQVETKGDAPRQGTIAVSWHPNWQARVDGKRVPLQGTDKDLLTLSIPSGSHSVDLIYVRRWSERLYDALSLVTLLVVLAGLVRSFRRSSPVAEGLSSEPPRA